MKLESKFAKIWMGAANTWLGHVEWRAYKVGFEECKTPAIQVLLMDNVHLLQVPIKTQPLVANFSS